MQVVVSESSEVLTKDSGRCWKNAVAVMKYNCMSLRYDKWMFGSVDGYTGV